ncbi:uncharacterized protein FIBRA_06773 [Fibroporia radiculosa]|uniref:DUF7918 domain-containing protein n=1 Tax=Fibroporia radiculosa TaxID=599839 RepID=J4HZM6_9APHY|nr:uncharacterized protein FIBRA_06773 [Fibroporia radiculosa]CCM04592.1 predicted protein [Fibroporia radiculosa]
MITHLNYSAWITCDGREIIEYEPVVNMQARKISCWIPSEEGKSFTVHWRDHGNNIDTATYLKLDGHSVPGRFLYGRGEAHRSAVRVARDLERPFLFIKVLEDTKPTVGKNGTNDAGTIVVKIKRIVRKDTRNSNALVQPPPPARDRPSKDEPCVSFGAERQAFMQMESTWSVQPYDPQNPGTYVTFVFRYRSREFLMAQGIMSQKASIYRPLPLVASSSVSVPAPLPASVTGPELTPPVTPALSTKSESSLYSIGSSPEPTHPKSSFQSTGRSVSSGNHPAKPSINPLMKPPVNHATRPTMVNLAANPSVNSPTHPPLNPSTNLSLKPTMNSLGYPSVSPLARSFTSSATTTVRKLGLSEIKPRATSDPLILQERHLVRDISESPEVIVKTQTPSPPGFTVPLVSPPTESPSDDPRVRRS